jgi:Calcium-activated chloride channel
MEFLAMLSIPTNLGAIYFSGGNGYANTGADADSPVVVWLLDENSFWTRGNIILLIVAVEHVLILIKVLLANLIPDVPGSVLAAEKKRAHTQI